MSHTLPFRGRSKLQLAFAQLTGSPRHPYTPRQSRFESPLLTPAHTPLATRAYSPHYSVKLKPPTPYGGPIQFSPRRSERYGIILKSVYQRAVRRSRLLYILILVLLLIIWCSSWASEEIDAVVISAEELGRQFHNNGITRHLQFYPATNPKIHASLLTMFIDIAGLTIDSMLVAGPQLRTVCAWTGHSPVACLCSLLPTRETITDTHLQVLTLIW